VVNPRRGDGDQSDLLVADLIIYDDELIRKIDDGKLEVSCGYNPEYFEILGEDNQPILGEGEQDNIIYNHLALVSSGRCGWRCSIGDSATADQADDDVAIADRLERVAERLRC